MNKIIFLLLILCAPAELLAQDSSKEFFDKNFAADPLGEGKLEQKVEQPAEIEKSPASTVPPAVKNQNDLFAPKGEESGTPVPSVVVEERESFAEGTGEKIVRLGVIVNGDPTEHLQTVLKEYRKLIDQFETIMPGDIVIIGLISEKDSSAINELIPENAADPKSTRLLGLLGKISYANEVPSTLGISHSPAWIIETQSGENLVEGFKTPLQFINKIGQFVKQ